MANLVEPLDEAVPALLSSPTENWKPWFDYWHGRIAAAQADYDARAAVELPATDAAGGTGNAEKTAAAAAANLARQRLADILDTLTLAAGAMPDPSAGSEGRRHIHADYSEKVWRGQFALHLLADDRLESVHLQSATSPQSYRLHYVLGGLLLSLVMLATTLSLQGTWWPSVGRGAELQVAMLIVAAMLALLADSLWAILAVLGLAVWLLVSKFRRTSDGTRRMTRSDAP
jgi:hypothetical protein